ncbi:isochorismate synthase [Propionicicella superfundia]|uniref:isochorismate synthase n=1 Tax=Propionicicella superfundia TaxID=348582 RepID=UPI00048F68DE|nr:isochorismate synthase [Propionicicella superfundia]
MVPLDAGRTWRARTVEVPDPGPLLDRLPAGGSAWIRRGQGFVALGTAVEISDVTIAEADAWWTGFSERLGHDTELPDAWGTGPLALASFPFDAGNTGRLARVIVPRTILGRRGDVSWLTVLTDEREPIMEVPGAATPPVAPRVLDTEPFGLAADDWASAVEEGRSRVAVGVLSKVVLARGETVICDGPVDLRSPAAVLAREYESTWTYLMGGLVGGSPEMLVRRQGGLATSRVLAGTIPRNGGEQEDLRLAASLARSGKNLIEHELAVASVAEAMAPLCSGMNVPDAPYVLQLPNVFHLASDVTGVCRPGITALGLVARLHPSAAVCGTPTDAARAAIAEIEHMDRGHYAGPVGWIDTRGDGEWAIALRSGELAAGDPTRIRVYAGAGIVAESDPCEELAETGHKLAPMYTALGLPTGRPAGRA